MGAVLLALFDRAWLHVPAGLLQGVFVLVTLVAAVSTLQYVRFGLAALRHARQGID
jgi:hypothetical protein